MKSSAFFLLALLLSFNANAFIQGEIGPIIVETLDHHPPPPPYPPETPEYPEPTPPQPQPPKSTVTVHIQNNCYTDVFVATKYQAPNEVWGTKTLRIRPGQVVYNSEILNHFYYLYAQTYDGRVRWSGEHQIDHGGVYYPSALVSIPKHVNGHWTSTLNCY